MIANHIYLTELFAHWILKKEQELKDSKTEKNLKPLEQPALG